MRFNRLLLYEFVFPKDNRILIISWDAILPLDLSDSAEGILPGVTDFNNPILSYDCEDSGGEFHLPSREALKFPSLRRSLLIGARYLNAFLKEEPR